MYKLVLFDFDYTLVDTSKGIVSCVKYALGKMGAIIPEEYVIRSTIGMPLNATYSARWK